jgi:tetratricopeptide (TPR) repeat protein
MKLHRIVLGLAACLAAAGIGRADQVTTTKGERIQGTVRSMTPQSIQIEGPRSASRTIPANEVDRIDFTGQPQHLVDARTALQQGNYDEAKAALDSIDLEGIKRKDILTEVAFTKAECAVRLALGGAAKTDLVRDGKEMIKFLEQYPNSWHYYEASEFVGNILVAYGSYDKAQSYFAPLAQSEIPEYKFRAAIASGRVLLAQGKAAAATAAFDSALGMDVSEAGKALAKLGKARCLALGKQTDQAIKMAQEVVNGAKSDDAEVNAQAYNTLGTALRAAGRKQDALFAFLHVEVMYPADPQSHAEALYNLCELFSDRDPAIGKANFAAYVRRRLMDRYPTSSWAKKLK